MYLGPHCPSKIKSYSIVWWCVVLGRTGSLVPWSLRLLVAQLPALAGKHTLGINRLFRLLATVRIMLDNINKG